MIWAFVWNLTEEKSTMKCDLTWFYQTLSNQSIGHFPNESVLFWKALLQIFLSRISLLMFLKGHCFFLHTFTNQHSLYRVSRKKKKRQRGTFWAFFFWLAIISNDNFRMLLADTVHESGVFACVLYGPKVYTPCVYLWSWGHSVGEVASFWILWSKSQTRDVAITNMLSMGAYTYLFTHQFLAIVK